MITDLHDLAAIGVGVILYRVAAHVVNRWRGRRRTGEVEEIVCGAIIGYTGARTLAASQGRATNAAKAVLTALAAEGWVIRRGR